MLRMGEMWGDSMLVNYSEGLPHLFRALAGNLRFRFLLSLHCLLIIWFYFRGNEESSKHEPNLGFLFKYWTESTEFASGVQNCKGSSISNCFTTTEHFQILYTSQASKFAFHLDPGDVLWDYW